MSTEIQNPYLDYLIDPSFHRVNKRFVLSFEGNAYRASYKRYFIRTAQIKYYNIMINEQNIFDQPVNLQ